MSSIVDRYLLSKLVRNEKSWEDILQFCSTRQNFCSSNRREICKKILKAKFKVVKKGTDYCKIIDQFVQVKRGENSWLETPTKSNFVLTTKFIELAFKQNDRDFKELKQFLNDNFIFGKAQILASNLSDTPIKCNLPDKTVKM